jgi:hypothetical protein
VPHEILKDALLARWLASLVVVDTVHVSLGVVTEIDRRWFLRPCREGRQLQIEKDWSAVSDERRRGLPAHAVLPAQSEARQVKPLPSTQKIPDVGE